MLWQLDKGVRAIFPQGKIGESIEVWQSVGILMKAALLFMECVNLTTSLNVNWVLAGKFSKYLCMFFRLLLFH